MALFLTPNGDTIEREMDFAALHHSNLFGTRYLIDGVECTRLVAEEMRRDGTFKEPKRRSRGQSLLWNRPFRSDALGVNPEQADEAEAYLRSRGVTAEYDRVTGELITTSEKQFQDAGKAMGLKTGRDGWEAAGPTGTQPAKSRRKLKAELQKLADEPLPAEVQRLLEKKLLP